MRCERELTRRGLLGSFLASWAVSLLGKRVAAEIPEGGFDPIRFNLRGFIPASVFQRRYRMDATILLLGAPVFTRDAAGGGYASVETDRSGKAVALQFAAGSFPTRAHGLNRFGILREALVDRGDGPDLAFAGLMTRSREESFEQGRRALASGAGGGQGVIARGRSTRTSIQACVDHIDLSPDSNWSNLDRVLSDALRREPAGESRTSPPTSAVTFLQAMRSAALCRERQVQRQFLHAGKLYWLDTRRNPDNPLELEGSIHDLAGTRCAEFKTAYASGDESGIPIRIEYRPRSFLRLTFQIDREATQPRISVCLPGGEHLMNSAIHLEWQDAAATGRFRTAVSLHSHTLHSRESLDFIDHAATRAPILAAMIRHGAAAYRKKHGATLDLTRGWWTPPLGANDAWLLEKSQIEARDRNAIVSLTDHDNIEAPVSLQVIEECQGTPISVEWTVPFGPTFFHLGVHNLPAGRARELWDAMGDYGRNPDQTRLGELLTALAAIDQVLIVFNHPLWDERGIGQAAHRGFALDFLRRLGPSLHALELSGLRPWKENSAVIALARAHQKPVISGGDRHALEPNALLNLTNAGNFAEFAEEVREGWSNVLVLRHYREPHALRIFHNMMDVLRTYERHANGWKLWSDRVFYVWHDGQARSLTELFGEHTPGAVRLFVGTVQFASAPRFRRVLRGAFAGPEEVTL